MAEAAEREDGYRLLRVTSYSSWDAHMIYVSDVVIASYTTVRGAECTQYWYRSGASRRPVSCDCKPLLPVRSSLS